MLRILAHLPPPRNNFLWEILKFSMNRNHAIDSPLLIWSDSSDIRDPISFDQHNLGPF